MKRFLKRVLDIPRGYCECVCVDFMRTRSHFPVSWEFKTASRIEFTLRNLIRSL